MPTKLPIKINPERLKDTLVEIRYQSDIPFEYRLGLCHKVLMENGFRIFEPISPNPADTDILNFFLVKPQRNVFADDTARFYFEEDKIVFNSNGTYQGWAKLSGTIRRCIEILFKEGLAGPIRRIGLRYVSEFDSIQIFDQLKWKFEYSWKQQASINTSFRTEWIDDDDRIIVNLLNNVQREEDAFSLMDIDVNHTLNEVTSDISVIFDLLNRLHEKEKQVFFGLMKNEFLESLNPTYE